MNEIDRDDADYKKFSECTLSFELLKLNDLDQKAYEAGRGCSEMLSMYELGRAWADMFCGEKSQSYVGETVNSVWQEAANCRTAETAADYRRTPSSLGQQMADTGWHKEKPTTRHFLPEFEAPVSMDLIFTSGGLSIQVRRIESARMEAETTFIPPWKDRLEFDNGNFAAQEEAFQQIQRTISKHSPREVSTLITLANDLLVGSGARFVYNNQGYVDLQTRDGCNYTVNNPNHKVHLDGLLR